MHLEVFASNLILWYNVFRYQDKIRLFIDLNFMHIQHRKNHMQIFFKKSYIFICISNQSIFTNKICCICCSCMHQMRQWLSTKVSLNEVSSPWVHVKMWGLHNIQNFFECIRFTCVLSMVKVYCITGHANPIYCTVGLR